MSSWSQRRKTLYLGIAAIIIIGAVIVPGFLIFYRAPTCTDGIRNGNELAVDCGGSCPRLCQNAFLPPSPGWTRFEEVAPGLYNVAAYIVNPNSEGEARNVPYTLSLYDDRGILIIETNGTMTLPPHRNTLAFQGAVTAGKRIPAKALFDFETAPNWYKASDTLASLSIGEKNYSEDESGSSLLVTLKNSSTKPIGTTAVYVILYDKDGNTLGFSKTIVDSIHAQGTTIAPYTWPRTHDGKVISIEVLPVAE
jgi:hypothetical protein